jgi:DNA-binding beta-propeller fold protein YncE
MNKPLIVGAVLLLMLALVTCKRDPIVVKDSDYPEDIAVIIHSKCAVAGCHNGEGHAGHQHGGTEGMAGLDLSSWEEMFAGSDHGPVVIPYRPDFSSLLYFVNTYPDLGVTSQPTMPKNADALSRDEVQRLKNWIAAGAPDRAGNIKFAGDPNRKKYYVINQGCRVVTVVDAATNLPMRYIDVADASEQTTSPHMIKVSPDGQYWYVCAIGSSYIKRFRTADDLPDGKIFVGNASWNTIAFTPDSKFLFAVDWAVGAGGKVKKCDLVQMKVTDSTQLADAPHASCVSLDGKYVYIGATAGNYLYKIHVDSLSKPASYEYIDFDGMGPSPSSVYNPHEIIFAPDGTKYYVSCSGNNNTGDLSVKVFSAANDALLASVPLPSGAYEMSISKSTARMFVTSYESTALFPYGQLMVINLAANTFEKSIATGVQPHGVAVDDAGGLVYVANRNLSGTAPPHHTSVCGGQNGTLVFVDLNALVLVGREIILARDPYSISIRF